MDDIVDELIAGFDHQNHKVSALDEIGVACRDDRAAGLYLSVGTSDRYDLDTRQYAVRLLRYAFPDTPEMKVAVVAAALRFATDKNVDETLRLDFLEVILFSHRTYDTVRELVEPMADSSDSPEVRRTACDVLRRHLDKEEIRRAVDEVENRDGDFNEYCSQLLST